MEEGNRLAWRQGDGSDVIDGRWIETLSGKYVSRKGALIGCYVSREGSWPACS